LPKQILIVDIPEAASAEAIECLLAEPYEQGYFLKNIFPWPGIGARAFYSRWAKPVASGKPAGNPSNTDGREAEAIQIIRANPESTLRELVVKLKAVGIERGRSWVGDKRNDLLAAARPRE
jgi:3-deoxy-D-arabino-heptulosonate 7-phosphate (DAHP) synthase